MKFWCERHNNLVRPHKRECMVAAKFGPDLRLVSLKKAVGTGDVIPSRKPAVEWHPCKIGETTVCSQWIAILVDPDDHLM